MSLPLIYQKVRLSRDFIFALLVAFALNGCQKDDCGPGSIDDPRVEFYAHGHVINFLTGEPEVGVKLLFMDQIGGSEILKLDTSTTSKRDGCFRFENARELAELESYFTQNPSLNFNHLNQTIRAHDRDYFHLFTSQGNERIFGRYKFNSTEEVKIHLTPSASIRIQHNTNEDLEYQFRWEFSEPALDFSRGENYYSLINADQIASIPAEAPLDILIYEKDSLGIDLLYTTTIIAPWKKIVDISF